MSSDYGENIKITLFGQSHAKAIGVVMDNIPAGVKLNMEEIQKFMGRRAPGQSKFATARKEADIPDIVSGVVDGITVGAPICAVIYNTDQKSKDYSGIAQNPRPSHADYPAFVKFGDAHDIRGGGLFSGRLTAPLCFAGAVCKQLLAQKGIYVGAHIKSVGDIYDDLYNPVTVNKETLEITSDKLFPVLNEEKGALMQEKIINAKKELDSVGGTIECAVIGLNAGMGEPFFGSIEGKISQAMFCIPAIKGIEFGIGFEGTKLFGSQHNDPYRYENGRVVTATNNNGGILGGLSTGMPIVFSVAVKPTPSIGKEQDTIDRINKVNSKLIINGRHDPCIVPRAVPCIEAAAAIAIYDMVSKEL